LGNNLLGLFLLSYKVCGIQYFGSTTAKFRFGNHKSHLRAYSEMSATDKENDNLGCRNFCSQGNQGLQNVKDLVRKEGQWACGLRSLTVNGLNGS